MNIGYWVCLSPIIFLIAWGLLDAIKRGSF
ncbi:hypothetical protein [Escherichia phage P762]|nr:hypothetical protein [Escherichia phage P762]